MAVAYNGVHAFDGRNFVRRPLRVTACNYDLGLRVGAAHVADESAGGALGLGCNATGIQDNSLGGFYICRLGKTTIAKPGGDGFSVRTTGAASKILDVVCFHNIQCSKCAPAVAARGTKKLVIAKKRTIICGPPTFAFLLPHYVLFR